METCGILHTENLYKTMAKFLKPIWYLMKKPKKLNLLLGDPKIAN